MAVRVMTRGRCHWPCLLICMLATLPYSGGVGMVTCQGSLVPCSGDGEGDDLRSCFTCEPFQRMTLQCPSHAFAWIESACTVIVLDELRNPSSDVNLADFHVELSASSFDIEASEVALSTNLGDGVVVAPFIAEGTGEFSATAFFATHNVKETIKIPDGSDSYEVVVLAFPEVSAGLSRIRCRAAGEDTPGEPTLTVAAGVPVECIISLNSPDGWAVPKDDAPEDSRASVANALHPAVQTDSSESIEASVFYAESKYVVRFVPTVAEHTTVAVTIAADPEVYGAGRELSDRIRITVTSAAVNPSSTIMRCTQSPSSAVMIDVTCSLEFFDRFNNALEPDATKALLERLSFWAVCDDAEPKVCEDSPDFVDIGLGNNCEEWSGKECMAQGALTEEGAAELRKKCPVACGGCDDRTVDCRPGSGRVFEPTEVQHSGSNVVEMRSEKFWVGTFRIHGHLDGGDRFDPPGRVTTELRG